MIRPAEPRDVKFMVYLGSLMHQESRFNVLRFNASKVGDFILHLINTNQFAVVAEKDGEIIGGFTGAIMPHYASDDLVAYDFALFLHPEHRGGMTGVKLVKAYREWALSRGAKMVSMGVNTGVHAEQTGKMFERIGFELIGYLYEGVPSCA